MRLKKFRKGHTMIKAIVFDKDGTLIELGQTWDKPTVLMMERLFEDYHVDKHQQQVIAQRLGLNEDWTGIVPNSIFAAGSIRDQAQCLAEYVGASVEKLEEVIEDYYTEYIDQQEVQAKLAPGVKEMLVDLKQDYTLCLVTNDNYRLTMNILEKLEILDYFDFIGCADQYGPKPGPNALYEISRRFNVKLDEMVYVGDSSLDMEYGQYTAASIGYIEQEGHQSHLEQADYLLDHMQNLRTVVKNISGGVIEA